LRNLVRWRTRLERCATRRRSARVVWSGAHTLGQEVRRAELRKHLGVDLVGLDLRCGNRLRAIGFDTVTRPACSPSSSAIANVIAVDSKTT